MPITTNSLISCAADGFIDVIVPIHDDGQVIVFMGDGTGARTLAESYSPGNAPTDVVLGDLDGVLDIVTSHESNSVSVLWSQP